MECEEIKKIIPKYFQHTASDEEIRAVEEHLCVCHDCRTVLGELMDKSSEAEEAATLPQEEFPSQIPERAEEAFTEEKVQEGGEEKKEEAAPVFSEREKDIEYFPGEDLEASMDKVEDILGKTESIKGNSGDESEKAEPVLEKKEEGAAGEEPSFEVISDPLLASKQEFSTESGIEDLDVKGLEPAAEEAKEPEEKTVLPLEEEKTEEKAVSSFEEERVEKTTEEKEEIPELSKETGAELKKDELEKPAPKEEDDVVSLEEASYSQDETPLEKSNADFLEYLCLAAGLGVLGFLAYLFLKG